MFERFNHIVQDKLVALRVGRERRIQLLNGRPPLAQCLKSGLANHERMSEGALCCLALIVYRKAVGRFKAAFFARLGYSRADWQKLQRDILQITRTGTALERQASTFGRKYEVNGILRGPSGRDALVTTVWIVKIGEDYPRLVTVYPGDDR